MESEYGSSLNKKDYPARHDGADDVLWEPLWRLRTELRPVERALLTCLPLRRLHFLHHGGGSYLSTYHMHSRLQHTLGVFALIAHFVPDDDLLRVAALLHDVGHAPFCHALERLDGVDHHRWTINRILSPPIADILAHHNVDPQAVASQINGDPPSCLRNGDGILHADHLDSWVRSAQAGGILPLPAHQLLARLRLSGPHLDTDVETAELLVELIVAEARLHCSPSNVGTNVLLKHLVQQALDAGALTVEGLATITDQEVQHILFNTPITAEKARCLWYQPHTITVRRLEDEDVPPEVHLVKINRLYLDMPLADGQTVTQISDYAAALVTEARRWRGTYIVCWNHHTRD
ncbi:MAG: HD domain-containing protein [Chloroflexi bacterium]|nr:HD domain-containing protein [Chloroflexota bacterium]